MRYLHFFELHVQPELAQLRGNVVHRSIGLNRSSRARADVLREMGKLVVGIIVRHCRRLDGCQFFQQLRRKTFVSRPVKQRRHTRSGTRFGLSLGVACSGGKNRSRKSQGAAHHQK